MFTCPMLSRQKGIFYYVFFSLTTGALFLSSCKKNNPDVPPSTDLLVASLTPDHGFSGISVQILGNGFSSVVSEDVVTFNGVAATVTAATTGKLTVVVPANAGTGNVKVSVNGKSDTGPVFTYDAPSLSRVITLIDASNSVLASPTAVCVDIQGNVYVADQGSNVIRKITSSGTITTIGNGHAGFVDGSSSSASFNVPWGLCADKQGNVYVADSYNNVIRKIAADGTVSTFAGTGDAGRNNGPLATATFSSPHGITIDTSGGKNDLYITDFENSMIRKISNGTVSTLAGTGTVGNASGPGNQAQFNDPSGIVVNNNGYVYVADVGNNTIRGIHPDGTVDPINGVDRPVYSGLNNPNGIAIDAMGNIYVADTGNGVIKIISAGATSVNLLAGSTVGYTNGSLLTSQFHGPIGLAVDANGNIYVADYNNNAVRKITY